MNFQAIRAIYIYEMSRTRRTLLQSVVSPILSTALYFVVFGSAIGSRISHVGGVSYGAFIVPGLIMLNLLTQSISNASFGIYFPRFVGTIYEILSAPVSAIEIVIGYVGASASKSIVLGLLTLATATVFINMHILHPFWMLAFLVLTSHRHLGRQFREAAVDPTSGRDAAHVSWREFLFDRHAAAVLAQRDLDQSGGLSHQRLPLELLRPLRYQCRHQPWHDIAISRTLPWNRGLDIQDRLPAEVVVAPH
jgi:hypothetical protein